MRGLNEKFLYDLKEGELKDFLIAVHIDDTLCFEIRENYVNIYYRGGNILKIKPNRNGYSVVFDMKYCNHVNGKVLYGRKIETLSSYADWLESIPFLKAEMDLWLYENPKPEREFQQLILRENNNNSIASGTDYYIADIEYANSENGSRFDMLGVKWPSTSAARKSVKNIGLSFIEVKYGDGALTGGAGLKKHVTDILTFLQSKEIYKEVETLFNQKIELGLIRGITKKISLAQNKQPEFIFVFANHKPAKDVLLRELEEICQSEEYAELKNLCDMKVAQSAFMGYGLYSDYILSLEDFIRGC